MIFRTEGSAVIFDHVGVEFPSPVRTKYFQITFIVIFVSVEKTFCQDFLTSKSSVFCYQLT